MSDMLEKLIGVEKSAAALLTEAEAEANRRRADARAEAQKKHVELLKEKLWKEMPRQPRRGSVSRMNESG